MRLLALAIASAAFAPAATIHTSVDLQAYLSSSGLFASCSRAGAASSACSVAYASNDALRPFQAYGVGSISATETAITAEGILLPGSGIPGTPASLVADFRASIVQSVILNPYLGLPSPYALVSVTGTWNPYRSTYSIWAEGATTSLDRSDGQGGTTIDRAFAIPLSRSGPTTLALSFYLTANEYDMPNDWGVGVAPRISLTIAPMELYNGDPLAGGQKFTSFTVSDVPEPKSAVLLGSSVLFLLCAGHVCGVRRARSRRFNCVGRAVPRRST